MWSANPWASWRPCPRDASHHCVCCSDFSLPGPGRVPAGRPWHLAKWATRLRAAVFKSWLFLMTKVIHAHVLKIDIQPKKKASNRKEVSPPSQTLPGRCPLWTVYCVSSEIFQVYTSSNVSSSSPNQKQREQESHRAGYLAAGSSHSATGLGAQWAGGPQAWAALFKRDGASRRRLPHLFNHFSMKDIQVVPCLLLLTIS